MKANTTELSLPFGAKEITPVRAYIMEGEIDSNDDDNRLLIQLNDKFYDMTECSDLDVLAWIKLTAKPNTPTELGEKG